MSGKTGHFESINFRGIIGSLLLLAVFVLPVFAFAGSKTIYVDDNASGTQDGSSSHPYKTIKDGIKHAKDGYTVHIKAGSYKENIEIYPDVAVEGDGSDKVFIKGKGNNDGQVVLMHDDTSLSKVTVMDGYVGVKIDNKDSASISHCVIKNNAHDGIKVKAATVKDALKASITDNTIKGNGKNGVFSETRRLIMDDNDIYDNGGDGIGILGGSNVWLGGNKVTDNDGSGAWLVLDGSTVWTKSNRFADNGREGIEIDSYGKTGRIDLKKTKIVDNGRYGIAKILRGNVSSSVFGGLTIQKDVEFWGNKFGNISNYIWLSR